MGLVIRLSSRAEVSYARLERFHRVLVGETILDLSDDPTIGRPTVSPPFPPGGMMYQLWDDRDELSEVYFFTIFYAVDEPSETLQIAAIGRSVFRRDIEPPSDLVL